MAVPRHEHLIERLEQASADLPGVTRQRMFGCDGFFADGRVYALIWKAGRLGLKLPDPEKHRTLMAIPGAEPWTAGDRTMANWVLVPEAFHDDPAQLREWTVEAHREAVASAAALAEAGAKKKAGGGAGKKTG